MSALEDVRARHAAELEQAAAERNAAVQLDPVAQRAAIAEGERQAREALATEVAEARPLSEWSMAELEAERDALAAEVEALESAPNLGSQAIGNLNAAAATARAEFATFDPSEFLEPVPAARLAEIAGLWISSSDPFIDGMRRRILEAYPPRSAGALPARLVECHHALIPLRAEIHHRKVYGRKGPA